MKNPFGITEKKCKKSDYGFFRDMIKNSLGNYVSQYFKFDFKHVRTSFQTTYKDVIILSKGKRRIGFYQIIPKNYELEVTRIFLSNSYRGKGIGKWYMQYFETLGFRRIFLEVWDNNPVKTFYIKLGYKQIGKKDHKVTMEKILN